jgi:hypothetical protein
MSHGSKFAKVGAIALIQIVWASGARATDTNYELKPISLPGATGAVALDYVAYDRATRKLWVPASNTGSVDVIDEATDAVSQVTDLRRGRSSCADGKSHSGQPRSALVMALCISGIAAIRLFV